MRRVIIATPELSDMLSDALGEDVPVYKVPGFKAGDRVVLNAEGLRSCHLTTPGMVREQHEGFIIKQFIDWGDGGYVVETDAEIGRYLICLEWVEKKP